MRDYVDSQYEMIEVVSGEIHYNYKCHLNSTHHAIKNKDEKLALVMYREKDTQLPCVHFVNYTKGKFVDNTIGNWSERFEYRFIRWVPESEFYSTPHILVDTQKVFKDMATFWQKYFGDIAV